MPLTRRSALLLAGCVLSRPARADAPVLLGYTQAEPRLTRAAWQGEVTKMRAACKAPVDAADVPPIVARLDSITGVH